MSLTKEQALAATNPNDTDENREIAAARLMLGAAAADVYWASRTEVERLFALHGGHAEVVRGSDETDDGLGHTDADVIDGTAEDDAGLPPGNAAPAAAPTNPMQTVATLRAQLQAAGIDPEA